MLRRLLELRERLTSSTLAAEVLYDSADPFTRKVVIDKGALADKATEPQIGADQRRGASHGGAAVNKQAAFMNALAYTFLWRTLK